MIKHIHILGASGSGTTTLAKALSEKLGYAHFDTDDYFWLITDPPYQDKRSVEDRKALLLKSLQESECWVLSGSLCGWGDVFIPMFDLVIYMRLHHDTRMDRIMAREVERYGDEIKPGGKMHENHLIFINWAAKYDQGDMEIRSRQLHEAWLQELACPILRIEEDIDVEEKVNRVVNRIKEEK